MANKRIYY